MIWRPRSFRKILKRGADISEPCSPRIWSYPVVFSAKILAGTSFLLSVSTRQKFNCGNVSLKMEAEQKVFEIPLYYLLGKFPRIFFQGQKSFGFLSLSWVPQICPEPSAVECLLMERESNVFRRCWNKLFLHWTGLSCFQCPRTSPSYGTRTDRSSPPTKSAPSRSTRISWSTAKSSEVRTIKKSLRVHICLWDEDPVVLLFWVTSRQFSLVPR